MGRNRLIYCLADAGLVVSTAEGEGGTWAGATEALEAGWVPVYVRAGEGVPEGNDALIARGAIALEGGPERAAGLPEETTRYPEAGASVSSEQPRVAEQQTLFGATEPAASGPRKRPARRARRG